MALITCLNSRKHADQICNQHLDKKSYTMKKEGQCDAEAQKKPDLPQHAQERLKLVAAYRISNKSQGLPPHQLQKGRSIQDRKITILGLPSPIQIITVRPSISWTVL
jgi:hypothetical protein